MLIDYVNKGHISCLVLHVLNIKPLEARVVTFGLKKLGPIGSLSPFVICRGVWIMKFEVGWNLGVARPDPAQNSQKPIGLDSPAGPIIFTQSLSYELGLGLDFCGSARPDFALGPTGSSLARPSLSVWHS